MFVHVSNILDARCDKSTQHVLWIFTKSSASNSEQDLRLEPCSRFSVKPIIPLDLTVAISCVAIGNPEWHVRKASHRGSKQQLRPCSQSLLLLLARATYIMVLFFTHIPFVVNHTINATPPERLQQLNVSKNRSFIFVAVTIFTNILLSFNSTCDQLWAYYHICFFAKPFLMRATLWDNVVGVLCCFWPFLSRVMTGEV